MLSQSLLLLVASSLAAAETVNLFVQSDSSEIDGNSLGFPHEGAGINYVFLGTSETTSSLEYDEEASSLSYDFGGLPQVFSVDSENVAVTVTGSTHNFSFDDTTLLVDGSADGFYACKNTNDPYQYSETSYELMYYTSDAPEDCLSLTLVNQQPPSSSSDVPTSSFTSDSSVPTDNSTSTSDDVTTTSDDVTTTSDDVTTTSDDVTTTSDDVTTTSDDVTTTSDVITTTSSDVSTSNDISAFTDAANGRYIPGAAVAFGLLAALV